MLPDHDADGLLPAGEHGAYFGDIEKRYCFTPERTEMWSALARLRDDVDSIVQVSGRIPGSGERIEVSSAEWWLGGSFVSSEPSPDHLEAAVIVPIEIVNGLDPRLRSVFERLIVTPIHPLVTLRAMLVSAGPATTARLAGLRRALGERTIDDVDRTCGMVVVT